MGCFAANLGLITSLHSEFVGAMFAIELDFAKGLHKLWLECDSLIVAMHLRKGMMFLGNWRVDGKIVSCWLSKCVLL